MGDLSTKWWKKYLAADMLEQQELLSNLPLLKELARNGFPDISKSKPGLSKEELAKEQEKFNNYMLTTMLFSYIEDLLNVKDEENEKKIKFLKPKLKPSKPLPQHEVKILKCKLCRKVIDHPRRGMCLNCYRKTTGLSKS